MGMRREVVKILKVKFLHENIRRAYNTDEGILINMIGYISGERQHAAMAWVAIPGLPAPICVSLHSIEIIWEEGM